MKKIINLFLVSLIFLCYFSCAKDSIKKEVKSIPLHKTSNKNATKQNLNISFLLDLSDRM